MNDALHSLSVGHRALEARTERRRCFIFYFRALKRISPTSTSGFSLFHEVKRRSNVCGVIAQGFQKEGRDRENPKRRVRHSKMQVIGDHVNVNRIVILRTRIFFRFLVVL